MIRVANSPLTGTGTFQSPLTSAKALLAHGRFLDARAHLLPLADMFADDHEEQVEVQALLSQTHAEVGEHFQAVQVFNDDRWGCDVIISTEIPCLV